MTGELFSLLRQHGLLAALMPPLNETADFHQAAFVRGIEVSSHAGGGLLNHLFSVRALNILGALPLQEAPDYLSGLLIGHELDAMLDFSTREVHLLSSSSLMDRYALALQILRIQVIKHPEHAIATGLHKLATIRGFHSGSN
jgi:2-dehydro-3-deoxygalactonokinase